MQQNRNVKAGEEFRGAPFVPLPFVICVLFIAGCQSANTSATTNRSQTADTCVTVERSLPEVTDAILESCRNDSGGNAYESNPIGSGDRVHFQTNSEPGVFYTLTLHQSRWPTSFTTAFHATALNSAESAVHVRCDSYGGCLPGFYDRHKDIEGHRLAAIIDILRRQP